MLRDSVFPSEHPSPSMATNISEKATPVIAFIFDMTLCYSSAPVQPMCV